MAKKNQKRTDKSKPVTVTNSSSMSREREIHGSEVDELSRKKVGAVESNEIMIPKRATKLG